MSNDKGLGVSSIVRIFGLVLCVLVIFALVRIISGSQPIYFSSFIEFISQVPTINISYVLPDLTIVADWGIFNFLRFFINMFTSTLSVMVFLTDGVVNTLLYVFYIVSYVFV